MSVFIYLLCYLCLLIFIAAVVYRIVKYVKLPMHLRWELYPVPHEGKEKANYGGSYLEEIDWWDKERNISKLEELKVMLPEIFLLKATWKNNRLLWYVSYPFHLGLYLIAVFIVLLFAGAVLQIIQLKAAQTLPGTAIIGLTNLLGPLGFILCIAGAIGLFCKRLKDPTLRNYSAFSHYFNLGGFILVIALAIATWLFSDPNFQLHREFIAGLISFNPRIIPSQLLACTIFLGALMFAYIPVTHMSHFFMKYFLYHDIRWGDQPNKEYKNLDKKLDIVLNYPVKWSAQHISEKNKRSWAEIATSNPTDGPNSSEFKS